MRFKQRLPIEDYTRFCAEAIEWLDDYALFAALSARYSDTSWNRWPIPDTGSLSSLIAVTTSKYTPTISWTMSTQ